MVYDGTEVRIATGGSINVGPVGSAAPTNSTTALNAAFKHMGYASEDGVNLTPTVDMNPIKGWPSQVPIAYGINEVTFEINFTLMQNNQDVTKQYFFGQAWTMGPAGLATLNLTSGPSVAQLTVALVVDWSDGANTWRYYVPRAICTEREEINLNTSDPVAYGLTYAAVDSAGSMGTVFTNDIDIYSS